MNRHVVPWKRKSRKGINSLMDKSRNEGENSIVGLYSEDEDSMKDGLNRWKSAILSKGTSISCFCPSNQSKRNLYRWIWIGHSFYIEISLKKNVKEEKYFRWNCWRNVVNSSKSHFKLSKIFWMFIGIGEMSCSKSFFRCNGDIIQNI